MPDFEIPAAWKEQALFWSNLYPDAHRERVCIAGGALRDLDHGLPIKDVDIFIQIGDGPVPDRIFCGRILPDTAYLILDREYMGLDNRPNGITDEVSVVWEYRVEETLYNVIFLTKRYSEHFFLLRLDFGLSRIMWMPHRTKILRHVTYLEDAEKKQFKIRRCETGMQLERSIQRGNRIIQRNYPGYKLVAPAVNMLPLTEG